MNRDDQLPLNVVNEYSALRSVIVNDADGLLPLSLAVPLTRRLSPVDAARIEIEERSHPEADDWDVAGVRRQVRDLHRVLRDRGIELRFASSVPDMFLAFATRDVGFVVGGTFFVARRRDTVRAREIDGLSQHLDRMPRVVHLEEGCIEGGDVMVDAPNVYVGLSDRTNRAGVRAFERHAETMGLRVVPIELVAGTLHLDCCFNIVAPGLALVQPDRIRAPSMLEIEARFEVERLGEDERATLASNVLVTSPGEVVSDVRNARLNGWLHVRGFKVTELRFDEVTKLWGSFRCCVLPTCREPIVKTSEGAWHV